ncbi:hypothetical protein N8143_03280 [Pelagibacteraceae bacterium]|nr:hypothetical protein [Pelagibacteraceae bacterium]
MKQIIYLLDGLTPYALSKFNKVYSGITNKNNFINKLMKNSHIYINAFGYGETYSTTYGFNTGQDIYKTNCDSFQNFNSFPQNKNLALYFKKNNYKNIFFRNAHHNSPTKGFYGRYLNTITKNFDYICLKKKKKNYTFNNFCEDQNLDDLLIKNHNLMFYFHDFTLHDHKLVYKNSSPKKYLTAFEEASKIIEKNLKRLKFNANNDILYFLSDHGMTYAPYDQMYFNRNFNYESNYHNLYLKDKIQFVFFVKFPNSKKNKIVKFVEPKKIFSLIKIYNEKYNYSNLLKSIKKKLSNSIIISLKSPISDRFNNFFIKETLHTHLLYLSFKKKISFALNHPNKYFDLIYLRTINRKECPKVFLNKIKNYYSKKNMYKKIFIYFMSLINRIFQKLLTKYKNVI